MSRPRRSINKVPIIENSDSEDEEETPEKKLKLSPEAKKVASKSNSKENSNESSSSESDIENYLQPVDKLDFSSSFFNLQKNNEEFDQIEKNIFHGVSRLSDSESDQENNESGSNTVEDNNQENTVAPKLNFHQLEDFTRKLEEAKLQVEKYNAKKKIREKNQDISNLLAAGESKQLNLENIKEEDLHSSDFQTTDDEWEEVKIKDIAEEKSIVPRQNIEIRVGDMPEHVKKKKGVDLLAAMKRRLNRIRKENQIYVHKVHLLCWIAHGNFLNTAINNSEILSQALSLLPSDKCYPADRPDLGYFEQIVQWYKKSIRLTEKSPVQELTLLNSLKLQMKKKEAFNKNSFVLIFIAILRALGLQCRIVLSFQVEPLRPPSSDLHSLSNKENDKNKSKNTPSTSKSESNKFDKSKISKIVSKAKSNIKKELDTSKVSYKTKSNDSKENSKYFGKSTNKLNLEKLKTSSRSINELDTIKVEVAKGKSTRRGTTKVNSSAKKEHVKEQSTKKINEEDTRKNAKTEKKGGREIIKKTDKAKKEDSNTAIRISSVRKREENKRQSKEQSVENEPKKEETRKSTTRNVNKKKPVKEDVTNKNNVEEKGKRLITNTNKDTLSVEQKKTRSKSELILAENRKKPTGKTKNTLTVEGNTNKDTLPEEQKKPRSKSTSDVAENTKKPTGKTKNTLTVEGDKPRSRSGSSEKDTKSKPKNPIIKVKLDNLTRSKKIPQLDGADDEDKPKRALRKDKINLGKLKQKPTERVCTAKKHSQRVTSSFNDDDSESEFSPSPLKKSPQKGLNFSKLKSPPASSSSSNPFDVKNDIMQLIKGRIAEQKTVDLNRLANKRKIQTNDSESDSDYMPEPVKKKHHDSDSDVDYFVPKTKVKKRIRVKKEDGKLKVLSSDDEAEKKKKKGVNIWLEVFLEAEEKWITADVVRGQVHCVNELFMRASHPVSYVVAWNNDSTLKDVTMRYCKNFNTLTRKLRIEAKWWEQSLKPFLEKTSARSKEEDTDLNRQQLDQPLPTTISEYKNHPLYALKRHVLKFESIYPPDIVPLGYVRGEAVYPRNCVYTCKSRDIWLKDARVVKPGETPYKIVKARPKYDKLSNQFITGQLLELFGIWQTTDYEPPTAENGVVPRNAYGNVELFKPCMLPKGTVLLDLPGLNKVCRKLNIDCATAIIGFDFHGGWSHAVYGGFVVCKEFEDTCIAAWHQEQEEIEKKENEKIEKRVYTNWKRLIKGLLIQQRLKARYDFKQPSSSGTGTKKAAKGPKFATKKKRRSPIQGSESESD